MDKVTTPPPSTERPRRVIKRYSNRKLYDTQDSRYVTLQQIGGMVRAGEDIQIIDNATKEDKTEVTLALILSEDLRAQPSAVPLGALRDLIQERGEKLLSQLRGGAIGRLIPGGGGEPDGGQGGEGGQERAGGRGSRLSEIVETSRQTFDQWQHTIDERIRAVLPGFGLIRELQAESRRLSQRVAELEREVAELRRRGDGGRE